MLNQDLIKNLNENPNFLLFIEHIQEVMNSLDTASGLSELDNERAGQEIKVRRQAWVTLNEIFKPFTHYKEKSTPTKKELELAKGKYGL